MAEVVERSALGRFRDAQLENSYAHAFNAALVSVDVATGVIGIMYSTILARKALELEGPTPSMTYAVLTALYFSLPLLYIAGNRQSYIARREVFLLVWIPSLSYFACLASRALHHMPSATRLLPLLFITRSQVLQTLWANLSMRVTFPRHAAIHLAMLLKTMSLNGWTCRWALHNPSWQQLCAQLASRIRVLARVVPLQTQPVAEPDDCMALLTFSQVTLGYLLPCFITWRLELASRDRFLAQQQQQAQQQQAQQQQAQRGAGGGEPEPCLRPFSRAGGVWWVLHHAWVAALVAALTWHVVEVGVAALPARWK